MDAQDGYGFDVSPRGKLNPAPTREHNCTLLSKEIMKDTKGKIQEQK